MTNPLDVLGISLFFVTISLGVVAGFVLFKRTATRSIVERLLAASLPALGLFALALVVRNLLESPSDWNASRLTVTFSLLHGYTLYYGPSAGPVLSFIYGPFAAMAYLPATLAPDPTWACIFGELLSIGYFYGPILYLHLRERGTDEADDRNQLLFTLYGFGCFFLLTLSSTALIRSGFYIHADAPALGLGAAACAALSRHTTTDSIRHFAVSALLAALSVWTKQTMVPILVALPVYVLIVDGRRGFLRYTACLVVAVAGLTAIVCLALGPQEIWFNTVTIPGRHPWKEPGGVDVLAIAMSKGLLPLATLPVALLTFFAVLARIASGSAEGFRRWAGDNDWTVLVIVGLFNVPTSLLGTVHFGGLVNSLAFTLYFLTAAATIAMVRPLARGSAESALVATAARLGALVIAAALVVPLIPSLYDIPRLAADLRSNPQQVAFDVAKQRPGTIYFPWNTLSSLMAEGKVYHVAYGLFDRKLAGFDVTPTHFRAFAPRDLQFIAVNETVENSIGGVESYVPEYSVRVDDPMLPGWTVYGRRDPTPP